MDKWPDDECLEAWGYYDGLIADISRIDSQLKDCDNGDLADCAPIDIDQLHNMRDFCRTQATWVYKALLRGHCDDQYL